MSEPTPAKKTSLTTLLEKVKLIASGADRSGNLPGTEEHDPTTAPSVAEVWCASVLRVFLLRTIEHVLDTRKAISAIRNLLQDPSLKEGEPWRSDLPGLRAEMKEMSSLVGEIVQMIKTAQKAAGQEGAPAEANAEAEEKNGVGEHLPAEASEEDLPQAKIDELAAALARGEKADLSALATENASSPGGQPLAKITPIKVPSTEARDGKA